MYIFEDAQRRNLGIQAFQVIQENWRSFLIKIVPGGVTEKPLRNLLPIGFAINLIKIQLCGLRLSETFLVLHLER